MGELEKELLKDREHSTAEVAKETLSQLIQKSQQVGDVYSISYESALVLIHDHYRKKVGGIPSLSFLIATRIDPKESVDYTTEDASILLLRVMDAAPLPNSFEANRVRVESAQRASGEDTHWDSEGLMDPHTHNLLSFAGVKCRVIGTFFLDKDPNNNSEDSLVLRFGSDLSNYYPNRGLKVYKPNDRALSLIVNYRDPERKDLKIDKSVVIGNIRYASTNRSFQGVSNVEVNLLPADLLGQKTALFGMTRTGKSNTTKIILQSAFNLRFERTSLRIGQIVFDPNGEYANENIQDANQNKNPSAIKNVWKSHPKGNVDDVVTYGILPHPNDPARKLMLLNFFEESNLQIGKEIIDGSLALDGSKYIQNFRQIKFDKPDSSDKSAMTRYDRRILAYRALLAKAGFQVPTQIAPRTNSLFNSKLLDSMGSSEESPNYLAAAAIFKKQTVTWQELANAFEYLREFMNTNWSLD
ncbi:helicase HerA domain-containing protein [Pseudanabaena sp. PCC 6802]|uniref:helicase HerA domain-containing protein n=1 Tax=Pseudanabaena sp. PCC 6802 TaxID=118173 RepID=UPI00034A190A|nr:DUF87 domain-containing protein [Pseudanabaena sp. PCC 6802]